MQIHKWERTYRTTVHDMVLLNSQHNVRKKYLIQNIVITNMSRRTGCRKAVCQHLFKKIDADIRQHDIVFMVF